MPDVRVVPADAFGAACLRALLDASSGTSNPVIGLPTGSTPVPLYEQLRLAAQRREVDVSRWRPFAIDEYGGPRAHPCSNRAFFARYWAPIPGAPPIEQFDPEAPDLEAECRRMAERLGRVGGLGIALLGIGMNGHLAFNEPGSTPESTVRRVTLTEASRLSGARCWGEDSPSWGLTLGLRELLGAPAVIVMAGGAAKAHIVAAALNGPETLDCPASFVRSAPNALWILDDAAAALLPRT